MAEYRKAIMAGALAGLTAAGTAFTDGTITGLEWIGIAVAVVGAAYAVWRVPNETKA